MEQAWNLHQSWAQDFPICPICVGRGMERWLGVTPAAQLPGLLLTKENQVPLIWSATRLDTDLWAVFIRGRHQLLRPSGESQSCRGGRDKWIVSLCSGLERDNNISQAAPWRSYCSNRGRDRRWAEWTMTMPVITCKNRTAMMIFFFQKGHHNNCNPLLSFQKQTAHPCLTTENLGSFHLGWF